MKYPLALVCILAWTGCATKKSQAPEAIWPSAAPRAAAPAPQAREDKATKTLTVTPGSGVIGRVAAVRNEGRFVILTFPIGSLPPLERRLYVYRAGLKVGEVKVSEPQRDINTAADIVAGECQVGDEVREE